jgi:hypothetical protein
VGDGRNAFPPERAAGAGGLVPIDHASDAIVGSVIAEAVLEPIRSAHLGRRISVFLKNVLILAEEASHHPPSHNTDSEHCNAHGNVAERC